MKNAYQQIIDENEEYVQFKKIKIDSTNNYFAGVSYNNRFYIFEMKIEENTQS